ncbi:IS200/IS605 family transposase [Salibacter sp.]|uniref:IS200/IS605 family transposase n=2 Tax=Salibacter sp. TaxID=2010995 RepID=UPI00286FD20F|nr:IS200/IS605 family transposase [Salibacter sp.]MDR9487948.1 IS200/IS605 family transposase [Salibacter sp.]
MPQSFNKIWIHAIWGTKYREPIIELGIEQKVHQFMSDQLREHGCPVRIINGMPDHVHCLFLQNPKKSIAEIIKQVKGSSSFYVNQNELITGKFAWQKGYGAYSVSESGVERVFQYIKNQKRHHQRKSFQEEFERFCHLHGISP